MKILNTIVNMKTVPLLVTLSVTGLWSPHAFSEAFPEKGSFQKGATIWAENCGRCHNIRSPQDMRNDQWITTMFHMRVRAGLTGQETRDILTFLQTSNSPAPVVTSSNESELEQTNAVETKAEAPRQESKPVEKIQSAKPIKPIKPIKKPANLVQKRNKQTVIKKPVLKKRLVAKKPKKTVIKNKVAKKHRKVQSKKSQKKMASISGKSGKSIYAETCIACHGFNGKGAFPGVPDLTKVGGRLSKSDATLITSITNGFKSAGSPMAMPAKGGNPKLSDEDIKTVLSYLKKSFK